MPDLPIRAETIPDGACPSTYNELAQLFASHFFAVSSSGVGKQWIFSQTKPTLEQAAQYAWFQLGTGDVPIRPYVFAQGAWLSMHPLVPGMTLWVFQDIGDITFYDGGDGTAFVSQTTGPMWQYARTTDLNNLNDSDIITARFPIVRGTLPSTTVLEVGDTGGEETHSLTKEEMPPHTHDVTRPLRKDSGDPSWESGKGEQFTVQTSSAGGTGDPPVVVAHNTMPPYVTGILLQRTNRTHYLISA